MSSSQSSADFVITGEHQRFAEFCDACRRYRYIGLCYGPPGVGKTLSARHYANWDKIQAYQPDDRTPEAALQEVLGGRTVFYTPAVVNSPGQVAHDILHLRNLVHAISLEPIEREEKAARQELQRQEQERQDHILLEMDWFAERPEEPVSDGPSYYDVAMKYHHQRLETPDPTSLIIIDETDRLKTAALEQVRDIFDHGRFGVVLVGMPGMEKRLSRYPQLYSRVGFVHVFRPLRAEDMRELFRRKWRPPGVSLPEDGLVEDEAVAAIIRITGGNFRLLHRLLTQIARLLDINALEKVTAEVVEGARESLVIGV